MKTIQIIGSQVFSSYELANAYSDARDEEGFEHVATLTNTPNIGEYTVSWGNIIESAETALQWECRMISKMTREREEKSEREFTERCEAYGRSKAAEIMAERAELADDDIEFFKMGFSGTHAAIANPRAVGKEGVFRAGRAAWGSADGQRQFRIESVKARSVLQKELPPPLNLSGLIANGEY